MEERAHPGNTSPTLLPCSDHHHISDVKYQRLHPLMIEVNHPQLAGFHSHPPCPALPLSYLQLSPRLWLHWLCGTYVGSFAVTVFPHCTYLCLAGRFLRSKPRPACLFPHTLHLSGSRHSLVSIHVLLNIRDISQHPLKNLFQRHGTTTCSRPHSSCCWHDRDIFDRLRRDRFPRRDRLYSVGIYHTEMAAEIRTSFINSLQLH